MIFTTFKFMIFMAVIFFLYYVIPKRKQWWLLLAASYIFYACASPIYLIFLVIITVITYVGAFLLGNNFRLQSLYLTEKEAVLGEKERKTYKKKMAKKRKMILVVIIVLLISILGVLKYSTFFFFSITGIFGNDMGRVFELILPIGFSFYMFQSLGYCIDVYREMATAENNFFKHALYVSFFPQLLQGPIGNYNRLAPQLFAEHEFSYQNAKYGLQRIAWGFFKKLVIANQISLISDPIWANYESYNGLLFWIVVAALYAFQLYADFSGYMDIANGCAEMLGIILDENFETPYFSKSIAEYWRRWHITLGEWFRNYVFYPILRTKCCNNIRKKYRKSNSYVSNTIPNVIALLVVWFLIGLWHGAEWSYVFHGLYHGSLIALSIVMTPMRSKFKKFFPEYDSSKVYTLFRVGRTFLLVLFGYLIFKPADLVVTAGVVKQMGNGIGLHTTLLFVHRNLKVFLEIFIGMLALFTVDVFHYKGKNRSMRDKIREYSTWRRWGIYVMLLLLIIFIGAYGKSELNQFAYFRF